MTNALTRALANADRSYCAAKATVADTTAALLAHGPAGGLLSHRPDLARAAEQLQRFKGWVYASIRPIAQRIAGQPIHVARAPSARRLGLKATGALEPLESHPLLDLLADPNELSVAWSLMFTTVASLELTGRQLWWLPGKKQILPIPTAWIHGFEGTTRFTSFKVRPPYTGEEFSLPADECCYFSYPDPADPHGAVSPLQAAASAVDSDEAICTSQAAMFRRGIHPSHAIIVGKQPAADIHGGLRPHLTAAQQRQIISAIRNRYSDVHNHGEPLILDGLIEDVKKLSNTPAEMDWLGSGQVTKDRIMQGFGVNPIIAGQVEGANRASSLAAEDHFCAYTVNPKIELLSQCLTAWLAPMFGGGIVVWIEPCQPRDDEMRLKWAQLLVQAGALTGDELRELSPFELPAAAPFAEPVAGGQDQQIQTGIEEVREAVAALKHADVPQMFDRIASRIVDEAVT